MKVCNDSILGMQLSMLPRCSISMKPCSPSTCASMPWRINMFSIDCRELCSQQSTQNPVRGAEEEDVRQFVAHSKFIAFVHELLGGIFWMCGSSQEEQMMAQVLIQSISDGSVSASPFIVAREIFMWLQFPVHLCFARSLRKWTPMGIKTVPYFARECHKAMELA